MIRGGPEKRLLRRLTIRLIRRIIQEVNVKRKILIDKLKKAGFSLVRHGRKHDVYAKDGRMVTIPRHSDIPEGLAGDIIRRNGL